MDQEKKQIRDLLISNGTSLAKCLDKLAKEVDYNNDLRNETKRKLESTLKLLTRYEVYNRAAAKK